MPEELPLKLMGGYNRFRKGYFLEHQTNLTKLAEGQTTDIAVLTCCDSRVDPTIIFDAPPGELFIIRNVANLVPEFENDGRPKGTSSALEFAVTGLNVAHIVILGHAQCGGVRVLMDEEAGHKPDTFVEQWMTIAEPVRQNILARNLTNKEKYTACEKETIIQSLQNLMTFPWIKERVEAGGLTLHGWYYDLNTATLLCFDPDEEKFIAAEHGQ